VLFLSTVLPGGRRSGGEVVADGIVAALRAAGHEVVVLGYERPGEAAREGELSAGRRPIETSSAGLRAYGWMARALATRVPYSSAKYRSGAYLRAVRDQLDRSADLVVVEPVQPGFALEAVGDAGPPVVFIPHNAEGSLYGDLAAEAGGPFGRWVNAREARLIGRVEVQLAERARQVWALTDADAAYFRSLCPAADVRTLRVAPSFDGPPPPAAPAYDVGLIGSWTWRANRAGLDWFVEQVVPQLGAELRIAVAGAGSEQLRGLDPRIEAHGVVPDAREFLARARVAAVPSVQGGGIQVKTLDAIAIGIPVVATPVAVRGLDNLPPTVAVTGEAGEFARELRRLAAAPDRAGLRDRALAWARARRERLESDVAGWAGELAGQEVARAEPALVAQRGSAPRPA
jgi:glycosyltransferase involved in cell wall biosynthesis